MHILWMNLCICFCAVYSLVVRDIELPIPSLNSKEAEGFRISGNQATDFEDPGINIFAQVISELE